MSPTPSPVARGALTIQVEAYNGLLRQAEALRTAQPQTGAAVRRDGYLLSAMTQLTSVKVNPLFPRSFEEQGQPVAGSDNGGINTPLLRSLRYIRQK